MPLGGETVGTAYVRILADGSGLDESIRREFNEGDDGIVAAGDRHGQMYADSFAEKLEERPNQTRLRKAISDAVAEGDIKKDFFGSRNWKEFNNALERRFGEAGRRAGTNLQNELGSGLSFKALEARLANVTGEVAKAVREIQRDENEQMQKMLNDAYRMNAEFDRKIRRLRNEQDADFDRHVRSQQMGMQRLETALESLTFDIDRFARGEKNTKGRGEMLEHLRLLRSMMENSGQATHKWRIEMEDLEKRLRLTNPTLLRTRNTVGLFADRAGSIFGRGSRSELLNFFGSLVRGFINIGQVIPAALDKLSDFGQGIARTFSKQTASGAGTLSAGITAVGTSLVAGLPALIAFGAAMAALVVLISPVVALIGGLVGIVIALTSSLSFGLMGVIGALIGTLPVVGAGIAVLASAFTGLDKGAREVLKHDVRPVARAWKELGAAARSPIFASLEGQARKFGGAMSTFTPMFRDIGQAISRVGDYFANALQSKGFTQFRDAMSTFLPDAVESLGRSFGNVLGGMGGVFRALIPITQEFLRWLENITGEFAHWANSDEGQDKLMRFFRDAADSLHSVWGFLKSVGGLIRQLFEDSKSTGDTIFDDMAKGIRNFTNYLKENPEAVKHFFEDVRDLSRDIGKLVRSLAQLADALDNVGARAAVGQGIEVVALAFSIAAEGIRIAVSGITGAFGKLKGTDWGGYFKGMGDAILNGLDFVTSSRLPEAVERGLGNAARAGQHAFSTGWNSAGNKATRDLVGSLSKLPGMVRRNFTVLGGIAQVGKNAMVRQFQGVSGAIASKFADVRSGVRTRLSTLPEVSRIIKSNLVSKWNDVRGKITEKFNGIGGTVRGKLNALGPVASAIKMLTASKFNDIKSSIAGKFSGIGSSVTGRLNDIVSSAGRVASNVVDAFRGLAGRILSAVGSIHLPTPSINWPSIPGWLKGHTASGGIFEGQRGVGVRRIIGEAGAEAVVPLNRPLSQVDPAVRMLSAFAQGKLGGMASGGIAGAGRTIDASGWQIVTPNADARAVAKEVFGQFVMGAY